MKYFSNFRSLSTLGNDFISIYCIISNMIQININIRFTSWPVRWSCNNLLHWLCPVHLPRASSTCYEWIPAYQWGQSVLSILCSLAANTGPSITQWSGWCLNNLTESTQNCQYCRQTEFLTLLWGEVKHFRIYDIKYILLRLELLSNHISRPTNTDMIGMTPVHGHHRTASPIPFSSTFEFKSNSSSSTLWGLCNYFDILPLHNHW